MDFIIFHKIFLAGRSEMSYLPFKIQGFQVIQYFNYKYMMASSKY